MYREHTREVFPNHCYPRLHALMMAGLPFSLLTLCHEVFASMSAPAVVPLTTRLDPNDGLEDSQTKEESLDGLRVHQS